MASKTNTAWLQTACAAPQPTAQANNHGNTPPNSTIAVTTVSKIPVITPKRDFAKV